MSQIDTRRDHSIAAIRPKRWPLALASVVMIAGATPGAILVGSEPGDIFAWGSSDVFRSDVARELDARYEEKIELVRVDDPTAWDTRDEVEDESTVYIDGEIRPDCRPDNVTSNPVLVCDSAPKPTEIDR